MTRRQDPDDEDDWDEESRLDGGPAQPGIDDGSPPLVLARPDHPVSRKLISSATLKVLYRLKNTENRAYLCGGAVRDMMLGRRPKDFDVATDARPHELRRLFRNARVIGRRFRLVHILFHDETIEVSTFRRTPDPDAQAGGPDELLITSDNTWGSPREDAFRRDFTINALYYNIADFSVIDYVGGIDDLDDGLVRVIGDPGLRFCEDPVRMMRACEFAGRLGFTIEAGTQEGIGEHRGELAKAAPPRLTEELLQLLRCGHAASAMQWMLDLGLLDVLLPETTAMIEADARGAGSFQGILPTLDEIARDDRELPDAVLLGAVLLPQIMLRRFDYEIETRRWMPVRVFRDAVHETLEPFLERFALANYKKSMLVHALEGFHRLCDPKWTPAQRLRFASKSYFDDALALFEILVHATGEGHEVLEHWMAARRQRPRRPEPQVESKRRGRGPRRRRRGGGRRRGRR
ncbi:MAG: polynucleotide adenylyltransferase PcnB [Acidobacteriota bacterium]